MATAEYEEFGNGAGTRTAVLPAGLVPTPTPEYRTFRAGSGRW